METSAVTTLLFCFSLLPMPRGEPQTHGLHGHIFHTLFHDVTYTYTNDMNLIQQHYGGTPL